MCARAYLCVYVVVFLIACVRRHVYPFAHPRITHDQNFRWFKIIALREFRDVVFEDVGFEHHSLVPPPAADGGRGPFAGAAPLG